MKRILLFVLGAAMLCTTACSKYETVAGDPLETKIYTLDNGLKVYMSVNKDEPRLQANIAIRSGARNDPADNTGLAHYLEHLMFKGTEKLGTTDYEAEKVLLDQVEDLYEVFRGTSDPVKREAIYHQIDSLSYAASLISIPNEYDKSMSVIGAQGTNAYTSNDVTCYVENIPSNQIENWAKVQSDRFKNMVIRGFHTELETVYEEYNMYLNEDGENAQMAMDSVLFAHHPYGLQSVIGTSQHLKNPSIKAIKKQKATYYVPNNAAICLAGDFDPDEVVKIIEKYFGDWKANPELPKFVVAPEDPITAPVEKVVYGTEAEFVMLGWRTPGDSDPCGELAEVVCNVLTNNGGAGIIDIDINQQQKALGAGAYSYSRTDHGEILMQGYPKQGQSLEEVRDLLLASVARLRAGDFDDELVKAIVANLKLRKMRATESNNARVSMFVNSFVAGHDWAYDVKDIERLEKVTKQQIVDWANKYLADNAYVVVNKRNGANPKNEKIHAPKITPIAMNRDKQSAFLSEIQQSEVKPIEPVYVNYATDMSRFDLQEGVEVLYKKNEKNDIATVTFRFDDGLLNDPAYSIAFDYAEYLGTESRTAEQIATELFKLACSFRFSVGDNNISYSVTGLSENIPAALAIVEDLMTGAVADEDVLASLKADAIKSRFDSKFNQRSCNMALTEYVTYGPEYIKRTTLTNDQLLALTSEELLAKVSNMLTKQHKVLYYGPQGENEVKSMLKDNHDIPGELQPLVKPYVAKQQTTEPKVYIAPYDSRQFNYTQYSNRGDKFDLAATPAITLYNAYFGGGMNGIVFQEMREARALAYSAGANLSSPYTLKDSYVFTARIGSQNDKLQQAVEAFDMIINDMPQSEKALEIAKTYLDGMYRTQRINGAAVLNSYLRDQELGLTEPVAKVIFESLDGLTMEDVVAAQQQWVKDRTYIYGLLGDEKGMDLAFLRTLGPITRLSLEDIFGY